jgi:Putative threonine efflux protein
MESEDKDVQDFQRSLLFSVVLSITFGPIALIILRQSILHGRLSAVPGAFGAALADALYAAVALMGVALIKTFVLGYLDLLTVASIAYLFYLGVRITASSDSTMSVTRQSGFFSVFALTLTNPLTIVAITSYVIANHSDEATVNVPLSLAGFFIGSLACQMVYVMGGDVIGRALSGRKSIRLLNWFSGLCLIVFSLWKLQDFIWAKQFLWAG